MLGALTIIVGALAAVLKIQQHDERYFPYLLLPVAGAGDDKERHYPSRSFELTITAAGRLRIGFREIDTEELDRILSRVEAEYGWLGVPIIIAADRRVESDKLRTILQRLASRPYGTRAYLLFMAGDNPRHRVLIPLELASSAREFPPKCVLFTLGASGWRLGERQLDDAHTARVLVRIGNLDSRIRVCFHLEPEMSFRLFARATLFSARAGLTPTFLIEEPSSTP